MSCVGTQSEVAAPNDLRKLHGRGMAAASELYQLPGDQQEMDRLSLQHKVWTLMADGLYPKDAESAIKKALSSDVTSRQPMILDIGSGSGSWALEMALKYPHAKVLGMDLVQSTPRNVPDNCTFIKANATTDLGQYTGMFDVVQCRSVAKHVPDAAALTDSIWKTLRPGGVFLFADAVTDIYNVSKSSYPLAHADGTQDEADRSWFARWLSEVTKRWTSKALQNTEGDRLHLLLEQHGRFEVLGQSTYYSPINWDGGDPENIPNGEAIGKLMLLNVLDFLQSSRPSLLASGMSEDKLDEWTKNVKEEALGPQRHMFMKWAITWASRK